MLPSAWDDQAANVIDGKQLAASVVDSVKAATVALGNEAGVKPGLVGDDPASHTYVSAKGRLAKERGFNSTQHTLPEETTQEDLAGLVASLNADRQDAAEVLSSNQHQGTQRDEFMSSATGKIVRVFVASALLHRVSLVA
jgi:hypothetical protein